MSRLDLEIDDELMAAAMARSGLTSTQAVVDLALKRLVTSPIDADFIRSLEGIGWDGDLEAMRSGDAPLTW
jgi:Arc/MetJ family transcription regulator